MVFVRELARHGGKNEASVMRSLKGILIKNKKRFVVLIRLEQVRGNQSFNFACSVCYGGVISNGASTTLDNKKSGGWGNM